MDVPFYQESGSVTPYGIMVSHQWNEIGAIMRILYDDHVDLFVEIGAHRSGLTSMILPYCYYNPAFHYIGMDIDREMLDKKVLFFASMLTNAMLFYSDSQAKPALDLVKANCEKAVRALIYCDGGNKPAEFKAYSAIVPVGTLVMVHDFPVEFKEEDGKAVPYMHREERGLLKDTRQVIYRRLR